MSIIDKNCYFYIQNNVLFFTLILTNCDCIGYDVFYLNYRSSDFFGHPKGKT